MHALCTNPNDRMTQLDPKSIRSLQMPLPSTDALLPTLNHIRSPGQAHRIEFSRHTKHSSPPTVQWLGPFQRAIQAAVVAHHVIVWRDEARRLHRSQRIKDCSHRHHLITEFHSLDHRARQLVHVLIFQEEQAVTEDSETLALCYTSMLALQETFFATLALADDSEETKRVRAGAAFVARMLSDNCADANARMRAGEWVVGSSSPAAVLAAHGALAVLAATSDDGMEGGKSEIVAFLEALTKRWALVRRE